MQQQEITLQKIYHKLIAIENALQSKGIIVENDESELTDEFKDKLEHRRESTNYISHEEVKRRLLAKK